MRALDYAIRTENWELAALCLVMGILDVEAGEARRKQGGSKEEGARSQDQGSRSKE